MFVVSTVSTTSGSATVLGNQLYGPYGNKRYTAGTMGTAKGYTGQYSDSLSGLDYYVARYYNPVVGRFLSPDTEQDNLHGFDPYGYVNGNPETKNDPTGHAGVDPSDPFIQYVGAWYKYIHPLSHVWTNEFEIPNSAMPKSDFRGWARNYDTGTPNSVGRPDIVSLSEINGTFTVWEVKTSGLKINDRGKDFTTSEYTLGLGQAEAFWYANRAAREADNGWVTGKMGRWQVGSETNDVSIGLAMQLCGGVCRITFADGMIMEVKVASQGVLNYKIVKRPYGGVSIYPVVEAVMDREGKFDIRGELWKGLIKYYAPQPQ